MAKHQSPRPPLRPRPTGPRESLRWQGRHGIFRSGRGHSLDAGRKEQTGHDTGHGCRQPWLPAGESASERLIKLLELQAIASGTRRLLMSIKRISSGPGLPVGFPFSLASQAGGVCFISGIRPLAPMSMLVPGMFGRKPTGQAQHRQLANASGYSSGRIVLPCVPVTSRLARYI